MADTAGDHDLFGAINVATPAVNPTLISTRNGQYSTQGSDESAGWNQNQHQHQNQHQQKLESKKQMVARREC